MVEPQSPQLSSDSNGTPKKTIHQKLQLPSSQNSARRSARQQSQTLTLSLTSSPKKINQSCTDNDLVGDTGSDSMQETKKN